MTEPETLDLLSALLDREPVDPDRLAAVLERPDARALLVDFVRLRAALHEDGPAAPMVGVSHDARRWIARPLLTAAAAVLLVVAGALAGARLSAVDDDRPPEPTRVVRLQPNGAGGPR